MKVRFLFATFLMASAPAFAMGVRQIDPIDAAHFLCGQHKDKDDPKSAFYAPCKTIGEKWRRRIQDRQPTTPQNVPDDLGNINKLMEQSK